MTPTGLLRRATAAVANLAFPPGCDECGGPESGPSGFCIKCVARLVNAGRSVCERCAATVGPNLPTDDCPECRDRKLYFQAVLACGPYDGALGRRTVRAKTAGGVGESLRLGRLWATVHGDMADYVDAVIPVPTDRWTRLTHPHRAADVMAEQIAARLDRPSLTGVLRKVCRTPKQAYLSRTDRENNLRNAFACRGRLTDARILLVDDVVTTMTTANQASRALIASEAASVVVATACRTTRRSDEDAAEGQDVA